MRKDGKMRALWFIAQIFVVVTGALAGGALTMRDTGQFNFMNAGIGALIGSFYLPLWVYFGLFVVRISSSMTGEGWSEESQSFWKKSLLWIMILTGAVAIYILYSIKYFPTAFPINQITPFGVMLVISIAVSCVITIKANPNYIYGKHF